MGAVGSVQCAHVPRNERWQQHCRSGCAPHGVVVCVPLVLVDGGNPGPPGLGRHPPPLLLGLGCSCPAPPLLIRLGCPAPSLLIIGLLLPVLSFVAAGRPAAPALRGVAGVGGAGGEVRAALDALVHGAWGFIRL